MNELDIKESQKIVDYFKRSQSEEDIFYNVCFCLCVPQAKWKSTKEVIQSLKELNFYRKEVRIETLWSLLKPTRFYEAKTEYILRAKATFPGILNILRDGVDSRTKRRQLIRFVKGLGPKAASHLLRNLGSDDIAILDVHSMRHLGCSKPKTLSQYETVEKMYKHLASRFGVSIAQYDLFVWKEGANVDWKGLDY